jgi:hypothetical protein
MKLSSYYAVAILAQAANALPHHLEGVKARNVSSSPCAVVSGSAEALLAASPTGMNFFPRYVAMTFLED